MLARTVEVWRDTSRRRALLRLIQDACVTHWRSLMLTKAFASWRSWSAHEHHHRFSASLTLLQEMLLTPFV
jgi:hypothetical protein